MSFFAFLPAEYAGQISTSLKETSPDPQILSSRDTRLLAKWLKVEQRLSRTEPASGFAGWEGSTGTAGIAVMRWRIFAIIRRSQATQSTAAMRTLCW